MTDKTTTLGDVRQKVAAFIAAREWEQFHHPKDLAISLSLEAAELLEHFQWDEERRPVSALRKDARLVEQVSEELADVLHYVCNFANVLEIDLADALAKKMAKNEKKYPADIARGRAVKYGRLVQNGSAGTLTDAEI